MKLTRIAFAILPLSLFLANGSSLADDRNGGSPIVSSLSIPGKLPSASAEMYNEWNLAASGLSKEAFELALKGYRSLEQQKKLHKTDLLTIIDYSQPSSKKRLFVLNMLTGRVIFRTLVAHGRNSGYTYASSFSNDEASYKSSLGFYITRGTYTGINGYSLKLEGCEKGINDHAWSRAIVMHGADYASEEFLRQNGYLGRSHGCPAVPLALNKKIIDKIKNGSCMFLYYPSKTYINRSTILDT